MVRPLCRQACSLALPFLVNRVWLWSADVHLFGFTVLSLHLEKTHFVPSCSFFRPLSPNLEVEPVRVSWWVLFWSPGSPVPVKSMAGAGGRHAVSVSLRFPRAFALITQFLLSSSHIN